MRVLVLGGTTEASGLVAALAGRSDIAATLSLAGRTSDPRPMPVATRIGGFGGPDGLTGWLVASRTDLLVDATHPFATAISRNAFEASRDTGIPLLAIRRPPWPRHANDHWLEVDTVLDAAAALGQAPRRVFLTVGRLELARFLAAAPQHAYLVRTIEPIGDAVPPGCAVKAVTGRGPFDPAAEEALMRRERIELLVTKNSGGTATYGKIAAAQALGLPVVIVRQPAKPPVPSVETVEQAIGWIEAHRPAP